jgi:hypothetical protein
LENHKTGFYSPCKHHSSQNYRELSFTSGLTVISIEHHFSTEKRADSLINKEKPRKEESSGLLVNHFLIKFNEKLGGQRKGEENGK